MKKERLDKEVLNNAINSQKIGAETALDKVTVQFWEELKQYRELEDHGLFARLPVALGQTLYTNQRRTGYLWTICGEV